MSSAQGPGCRQKVSGLGSLRDMAGHAVSPQAPMTGLSHVQLLVSDVAISARWYATALGMEPYAQDTGIGYVALRHRGSKVVIVLTKSGESTGGNQEGHGAADHGDRLDHLAFAVPNGAELRAWAEHLAHAGIEHPGVVLENGNPSLQLVDPDGIAIELVAPGSA